MRVPRVPDAPIKGFLAFLVYFLPTLMRLKRFLDEKAIDLVSLEYPMSYMYYFYLLKRIRRVKLVVGIHGDDVLSLPLAPKYEQWLVKHLVRRADWLLAHSASLLTQAEQRVGPLNGNRSYIPYGIEPDRLRAESLDRTEHFILPERPYILTVAKLYNRKGLDVLLHAIAKLGTAVKGYSFLVVGDGPEEQTLRLLAADLGIKDAVVFTGELQSSEIAKLYKDCEFFVLPSRSEPFGIVLLEAMVFGKAIIATKVGGIPEFVVDGYNGILVPTEDSDALAEQIKCLIDDQVLKLKIGRNSLALIEERYSYSVIIDEYEKLFRNVVIGSSGSL
jgi:glycosyltransferase involved in cell wall biosynthesis